MIRLAALWQAVVTRLRADPACAAALGGPDRAHLAFQAPDAPAQVTGPWSQLVVGAVQRPWPPGTTDEGVKKTVRLLLRVEAAAFEAPGYSVHVTLEAGAAAAHQALEGWAPAGAGFRPLLPLACVRPVQPAPLWDQGRNLWVLTAEYQLDVLTG